jgi:hypothetical protein
MNMQVSQVSILQPGLDELPAKISIAVAAAEGDARGAMKSALAVGHVLLRAKSLVAHRQWEGWVKTNCALAAAA